MKRAIIVHCWSGTPDYAWYPWAKAELEKRGYNVQVPQMPDTDAPRLDTWLPCLQQLIGTPDDDLVLIGHSIGTVAIMRYLEGLAEDEYIGKAVLVAAFTDPLGYRELENFFETRLDFAKIKSKSTRGFTVIQSDNDPYMSAQYGRRLEQELGARLIVKHHAGHMSGEDGCVRLPEVAEEINP